MSNAWSDEDAIEALREARVTAADPAGTRPGAAGGGGAEEAAFSSCSSPPARAGAVGGGGAAATTAAATPPPVASGGGDGDRDDWRVLYRTIVGSLRDSSSSLFRSLSLETVVLGFRALTAAHGDERDDLPGPPLSPATSRADAALVDELLEHARWPLAFDAGRTPENFASFLRLPDASCVRFYAPDASPLEPAHAVVVDPWAPRIHVAVRGTTTWHDALTDLVAHTEAMSESEDEDEDDGEEDGEGGDERRRRERPAAAAAAAARAHAGMLRAARALHRRHTQLLVELLSGECAGYRVHCVGHSLGGGTAAILSHLWRRRRRSRRQRKGGGGGGDASSSGSSGGGGGPSVAALASAVECTTFGCPPTVSPELARRMARTRSLVYNHDMVPRASVWSLAALRAELERHAADAAAQSPLARWVRETGALTATQRAAGQLLSMAAAAAVAGAGGNGAAASSSSSALSRFARAGLAAGVGALAGKFKELHASAMAEGGQTAGVPAGGAATGAAGGAATAQHKDEPAPVALACPGEIFFLAREGEDAGASFELRRCPRDGKRPERILLKRSMLRDHMLTHMVRALRSVKEDKRRLLD